MVEITESEKMLASNNHNLIYSFLQKYSLEEKDYYDLAAIGLCKAAMSYDKALANFSTYAFQCMFTEVMGEIRKNKADKRISSEQLLFYQAEIVDNDGNIVKQNYLNYISANENVEASALIDYMFDMYLKELTSKEKIIVKLYREGYKQAEIGKIVGCSQSHVSNVKKKLVEYFS